MRHTFCLFGKFSTSSPDQLLFEAMKVSTRPIPKGFDGVNTFQSIISEWSEPDQLKVSTCPIPKGFDGVNMSPEEFSTVEVDSLIFLP